MKNKKLYIVNQTHWDREWYRTFEEFRFRMIEMLDKVLELLDKNEMEYFLLDGQTIILEDLKDVDPIKYDSIKKYISEGRIIVGPWYVLQDEFLVNGESLVRNLEIGMKLAKDYGKSQMIGYLPDTFGHVSQLPQIFKLYGIDRTILWRGIKANKSLLKWQGPDETTANLLYLPVGYYFDGLIYDDYVERFRNVVEKLDDYYDSGIYLEVGGDHLEPPKDYKERIQKISEELNIEVIETTPEMFFEKANFDKVPKIFGELRDNSTKMQYLLPGVLSARNYLKIANTKIGDKLVNYLEPLNIVLNKYNNKNMNPYIEAIWKELIKNQPHDSICGCSTDRVHRDMEQRYIEIEDRVKSLTDFYGRNIFNVDKEKINSIVTVFNPLERKYSGIVERNIVLPSDVEESIELYDDEKKISLDILEVYDKEQFIADNLSFPDFYNRKVFKVRFYVDDVPAIGTKNLQLKVVNNNNSGIKNKDKNYIENEYYKITTDMQSGICLEFKDSKKIINGLNRLVYSMDAGDEYNYSPPENNFIEVAKVVDCKYSKGGTYEELLLKQELNVPEGLNNSRDGYSDEFVKCEIYTRITLYKGDKTIAFKTYMDNNLKDMRLRVLMPLGENIENFYTDTAFDFVERKKVYEEDIKVEEKLEALVTTFPTLSTAVMKGEKDSLVLSHKGIHEFMVEKTEEGDAASLTLIRAVEWLSRNDLRTRGGGAGPRMETKEAQCQRAFEFDYGVTFVQNDEIYSSINISKKFNNLPLVFQSTEDKKIDSLAELKAKNTVLSSMRLVDNDSIKVTLFNPAPIEEKVEFLNRDFCIRGKEIKQIVVKTHEI